MVVNASQKDAPHAGQGNVARGGADLRLRSDQFDRSREFFRERIRSHGAILAPPAVGFVNVL